MGFNLNTLLKENVAPCENVQIVPSPRLLDEKGEPQVWTLRPLTAAETDAITTKNTPRSFVFDASGKASQSQMMDVVGIADDMLLASLVEPSAMDLENAQLQDSWGVYEPIGVLKAMLTPGEFASLREAVQQMAGFDNKVAPQIVNEIKKN